MQRHLITSFPHLGVCLEAAYSQGQLKFKIPRLPLTLAGCNPAARPHANRESQLCPSTAPPRVTTVGPVALPLADAARSAGRTQHFPARTARIRWCLWTILRRGLTVVAAVPVRLTPQFRRVPRPATPCSETRSPGNQTACPELVRLDFQHSGRGYAGTNPSGTLTTFRSPIPHRPA